MAVFIRKFQEGGNTKVNNQEQPQEQNVNSEVQSPKFVIGNYQIDVDSFYNDLERNFQTFRNMYEGTWTNKEREEILRDHDLFLRNLKAGNILGIDDAGRFSIVDAQNSGIDFSQNGSWGRYSYFVKQIADAEKRQNTTSSTPKKKFTNTSIIEDIYSNFFGGAENPDYRSFFDLDEVVDDGNGNKVRGVKNRVNALLDLLDENYLSKFDDADESLGGLEGVKTRIDRLRNALADGTLDNEDFASASALGLNLRGLLSTDGNLKFDDRGNLLQEETTPEATAQTEAEELRELVYGKKVSPKELVNRIKSWDSNLSVSSNVGVDRNFKATDYLAERMKTRNEDATFVSNYYRNDFFPKFFENLKTYTPDYLLQNPDVTVSTWQGQQKLSDYIRINLTLAIRNKLYGGGASLLQDSIYNELNQIVGSNFWTVPGSFDEETGTISLFNPDTGDYKRVSIHNQNLKFISPVDNKPHTLLEDYVYGSGVASAKKGAKLQLGGNINALAQRTDTDADRNLAFSQLFVKPTQQPTQQQPTTEEEKATAQQEYLQSTEFNDADIRELTSAGLDLASLGAAYIPGIGTAASAVTGLTSTGLHTYNLATDKNGFTLGDFGETVGNVALDVAGLIPFFGTPAKLAKLKGPVKVILKFAPWLIGAFGAAQLPEAAASLKKLASEGVESLTVQDYRNITNGIMAVTGAVQYHGIGKPRAKAMEAASGRITKEVGEFDVNIKNADGSIETKKVKIDSEELPEFRRKLEEAGKDKEKYNKVIQESPSIKRQMGEGFDMANVSAAKEHRIAFGQRVPFTSKTPGLKTNTEIVGGTDRLGNDLDARMFRGMQNFAEEASFEFKNPFNGYWERRYNVSETPTRATETPRATEASTPRTETPRTETPSTEAPKTEAPKTESELKVPAQKAQEFLNKFENILTPAEKRKVKGIIKRNPDKTTVLDELINRVEREKGTRPTNKGRNAKSATDSSSEKIKTSQKGSKLQTVVELRKQGGILKGQSGLSKENFYDLYKYKKLGNEELKTHNQNANKSQLNDHNNDFGLLKSYQKNEAYTSNSDLVRSDLQNYFTQGKFDSLQKFVDEYNNDARLIRLFWDNPHMANTEYGDNVRAHNQRFKRMFASRSQSNNENSAYNIGYQDNIEDVMGTSTWMRRMDRYKDQFDVNNPILSRIHKIDLGNGNFGYVYKKANGDIDILNNDVAEKILNNQSNNQKQPEDNSQIPGVNEQPGDNTSGNDWDWDVAGVLGGNSGVGTRKQIDLYKYLPATLAFGRMLGDIDATNRRTKRYLSQLQVPLQSPWQFHRQVYGDYGSLKYAEDQAAQIQSQMSRPQTSNATLSMLGRLEAAKLAAEQRWKGYLADNQMIHKTYEQSAAEEKENTKRRTDVANVNRGLLADAARTRAGILASADAANHNSLDAWLMNYVEKPIQEEAYKRQAYQDWYDYISMGPMEYDFTGDPVLKDFNDQIAAISDTDPQRDEKRNAILNQAANYRAWKAKDYRLAQLAKFRRMKPYIQQKFPLDDYGTYYTTGVATPTYVARSGGSLETKTKKSKDSSYPTAVIRAKSKDNDRLIKQILEVIRNHKDLAKGVRMTDYSKYIIKDQK